jgi:hypothetical protein
MCNCILQFDYFATPHDDFRKNGCRVEMGNPLYEIPLFKYLKPFYHVWCYVSYFKGKDKSHPGTSHEETEGE